MSDDDDEDKHGTEPEMGAGGCQDQVSRAECQDAAQAWVLGGAQIYAQALPLADEAVVTEIEQAFEGDAFAPQFGPSWKETAREAHVSANGLKFSFVTYQQSTARS